MKPTFEITLTSSLLFQLDDIYIWLVENIGEPDANTWLWELNEYGMAHKIWFYKEEDSVLFKLSWR